VTATDTPALDALSVNFADLGAFLDALIEIAPTLDDEQAVIVRAQLLDLVEQVKGALGTIDVRLVALLKPGESCTVAGSGSVVVEAKGKKTTNGAKLARTLAARIADTPVNEDGEALPPAVLCERTADELVTVFGLDTASTSFRQGELKKRNLRASSFAEWQDGEPCVVHTR
jgi:hypothetical protein